MRVEACRLSGLVLAWRYLRPVRPIGRFGAAGGGYHGIV